MSHSLEPLRGVPPAARDLVHSHLDRMRHDLGKYVSFQVRFLGEPGAVQELEEALRQDLLATQRGPGGSTSATELWARFRPALVGEAEVGSGVLVDLSADPDVVRLDAAMARVATVTAALKAGALDPSQVNEGVEAAREVTAACRSLLARARSGRNHG